ncbi:GntR family transcriptional regulator [Pelagibius sp. Alg239-R121]|uniref:GntR family transcriptional regulator n=1 Tax=Pelagibius sp. Alg239-R121 TaxID=2993448 RepID=UPI0024A66E70|nr:GntR family transcriptional regulator [Pelagibius sp. Alg239-R121]
MQRRTLDGPEPVSKTDLATNTLRDQIITLSLEPGYNIDEKFLLSRFDFGRTPLREALNRLIAEGLIESRGSRGLRVSPLNLSNTRELFDAYILAERMVASVLVFNDDGLVSDLLDIQKTYEAHTQSVDFLKVTKTNAAFHNRLAAATQNAIIARYSEQLTNLARRISFYIFKSEFGREAPNRDLEERLFQRPINEHQGIIDAIEATDRDQLVELMTNHAKYFRDRLRKLIGGSAPCDLDFTIVQER